MIDQITSRFAQVSCTINGEERPLEDCQEVATAVGAIFLIVIIPILIIVVIGFIFWIVALIHAIRNEDIADRTIWLAVLAGSLPMGFASIAGPVYYFAVQRPYEKNKMNPEPPKPPRVNDEPKP